MAEKLVQGDSLQTEFVTKFNGMADEVNALKEGGGGGAVVELSGESGTLTDEQYLQCINPSTVIKWKADAMSGTGYYKAWKFISPTYYYRQIYISENECVSNIIEIDQISHGWVRKSTAYSGGGSDVSVTQTLTSGTKIGAITVDGKTTALYAPEGGGSGGGSSVPADAIIDVDKLPEEENAYLFENGAKVEEYLMRKVVVRIVETLPEVGELFLTSTSCNIYYQKGDDEAYCYLTPDVPPGGNFTGWAGLSSGFGWVSDFGYGGVITDESQATDTSHKYLVYNAEEYINKNSFYATTEDEVYSLFNGIKNAMGGLPATFHAVDILPATGEPAMDAQLPTRLVAYYQKSDNKCYCWVPESLGLGVPMDMWLELSTLGLPYTVISSDKEAVAEETIYIVVGNKRALYWYNNGFEKIKTASSDSFGVARFEFLVPTQDAEGETSTANGYDKIPINEASMSICTELFEYINANRSKITNVQLVSALTICPVTVFGDFILYCSFSNLGLSGTHNQSIFELLSDGHIKMRSNDFTAAVVATQFAIVVTTA
ncbi:MAG: hypothetical protein J6V88_00285 [Kiritimatiellae bacterium]|nr:hypothetical protein [Kiritimatiellia bacterium]